jgi:hypothetical protein
MSLPGEILNNAGMHPNGKKHLTNLSKANGNQYANSTVRINNDLPNALPPPNASLNERSRANSGVAKRAPKGMIHGLLTRLTQKPLSWNKLFQNIQMGNRCFFFYVRHDGYLTPSTKYHLKLEEPFVTFEKKEGYDYENAIKKLKVTQEKLREKNPDDPDIRRIEEIEIPYLQKSSIKKRYLVGKIRRSGSNIWGKQRELGVSDPSDDGSPVEVYILEGSDDHIYLEECSPNAEGGKRRTRNTRKQRKNKRKTTRK